MRKLKKLLGYVIVSSVIFAGFATAKGFEGMVGIEVGPALNFPVGTWSESYGIGAGGNLSILLALPTNHVLEFSAGILAPSPGDELKAADLTPMEIPIGLGLIFPVAAENASTPYFGLGPAFIIAFDMGEDVTRGHGGYQAYAGYFFSPEQFNHTFFNLRVRYTQYLIRDYSDIRNLDILVGIGLNFH